MISWIQDMGIVVLAFLGGLLAPAAANAVNTFVSSRVGRLERSRDQADARSRQAAEVCFEELSRLLDLVPRYARLDRRTSSARATDGDYEALKTVRAAHDSAIASLEAHTVLLRGDVQEEMEAVLGVLRYAYDLPYRFRPTGQSDAGWHPDSAKKISEQLVRHARAVLASHLKNSDLPRRPEAVKEYFIANEDRNSDLSDYFATEVQETEEAVRDWRTSHGLSPRRESAQ